LPLWLRRARIAAYLWRNAMCMFCAAVPTVLSLGFAARHEQRKKQAEAAERGQSPVSPAVPISQLTTVAAAVAVVAAVVYHTHLGG
jgi:hypothetical protein